MIYKFKSKATGDLIMLAPLGDLLLRMAGREPAATGIVEVSDMARVRQRIEQAIAEAEQGDPAAPPQTSGGNDDSDDDERDKNNAVGLRQRMWPFIQMLKAAEAAGEPIVWGV
jgi:hypothetical protein